MPIELSAVIPWYSGDAFQVGFLCTLWFWVLGLGFGWLFDVLRKS